MEPNLPGGVPEETLKGGILRQQLLCVQASNKLQHKESGQQKHCAGDNCSHNSGTRAHFLVHAKSLVQLPPYPRPKQSNSRQANPVSAKRSKRRRKKRTLVHLVSVRRASQELAALQVYRSVLRELLRRQRFDEPLKTQEQSLPQLPR